MFRCLEVTHRSSKKDDMMPTDVKAYLILTVCIHEFCCYEYFRVGLKD